MGKSLHPMNIPVNIEEQFLGLVPEDELRQWAERALEAEGITKSVELSIAVVDDPVIQRLNRDYRGLDEPTDVLSFPWMDEVAGHDLFDEAQDRVGGGFVYPPGGGINLGEVVIAYNYAATQARAEGRPIDREIAHLLVHGVLHILGYDHEVDEEERVMREREEAILGWKV
ncbi:MAG: hypothetical protein HW403_1364 [Dehalococcoidia bacterium]|nr:hypothetical protein [Dehalococcoidia bacterium]